MSQVSKCCQAEFEAVNDELGDFVLHACKKCGQECKLEEVCEDCEGIGFYDKWIAPDDVRRVRCHCQPSKVEKLGEELFELNHGN